MNSRLIWSVTAIAAVAVAVFLVYGTHALTIVQRVALKVF